VSLTSRVVAGSLIIVAVLSILVVALADRRLETRLIADTVDDLAREARLTAMRWRAGEDADSLADAAGQLLGRRVTLIDSTGRVIGDSDFEPPALDELQNHASRPEVRQARANGTGWSRRRSPSAGDEELYVAVRAPLGVARVSMHTRAVADVLGGARRDVIVAALISLGVALFLTALFARGVSRPIIALRDVARRLADGDLAQRPQLSGVGEVGDLADALSRMAQQLEGRLDALAQEEALTTGLLESLDEGVLAVDSARQVVRANASAREQLGLRATLPFSVSLLPRDRALRDAIGAALEGARAGPHDGIIGGRTFAITARPLTGGGAVVALLDTTPIRRMETVRRDFIANVSHELRTPLTAIRGYAETLVGDVPEGSTAHRFSETIRNNARRMQHIVDDLLDLSRIESGGWVPAQAVVGLDTVARDAVTAFGDQLRTKDVELVVDVAAAPEVYADPTALRQVLVNLLGNALRHTASGAVTVRSQPVPDGVAVTVSDTGSGISPEHLPRIFERFYRVDPGRSRVEGGTGLGLAIVRHLVEAHGGRVWAESAPGEGTMVTAVFPAAG